MKKFEIKRVKKFFTKLSVISAISLSVLAGYSTQSIAANPTVEKVDYFADNGIGNAYAVVQAPAGVYADGVTYVSYQGDLEDPYVAAYNHDTEEWQGPFKAGTSLLGKNPDKIDNHGKPTMLIDDLGYIHLFFGGHGGSEEIHGKNPLGDTHSGENRHVVSKNPYDISSWEELYNTSPFGTYNQAIKMDNGDIYLFYRHGAHRSNWVYQKSTDHGRTFEEPVSFLKTKAHGELEAFDSWYAFATKGEGDDIIVSYDYHLHWKAGANGGRGHTTERRNAYYMVFDTKTDTWSNIEEEELSLPITREVADEKTLVAKTDGLLWTFNGSTHLDRKGNPHIGISVGTDLGNLTGGPKQTRHYRWTGEEWVGGDPVNLEAFGENVDTRGDFFIDQKTGHITFALVNQESGEGVAAYYTSTNHGKKFTKKELLRTSTGLSVSAMIKDAHPDARFMVAERRGFDSVKVFLLGDNGPVQRNQNDFEGTENKN